MLSIATRILRDYGRVLAALEPGCCALPRALLPHSKDSIRHASLTVLKRLSAQERDLRDALIRGLVFLEQFVEADEAAIVARGQAQLDAVAAARDPRDCSPEALAALRVINRIKLAMEKTLHEACAAAHIAVDEAPQVLPGGQRAAHAA